MLNTITTYLLGSTEDHKEEDVVVEKRLAKSRDHSEGKDSLADDWILLEDENTLVTEDYALVSAPPSSASTPAPGWNVTPPACFAKTCATPTGDEPSRATLQQSNFENLLIEHPSMSVYRQRQPSGDTTEPGSRAATPTQYGSNGAVRPRPRGIPLAEFLPPSMHDRFKGRSASPSNKAKLNANSFERINHSKMVESSSKRNYRKKRVQRLHSGANNDRKCQ